MLELAGVSDECWSKPLEELGQSKTKALVDDLLHAWERQLLNHGINVIPKWATLAVKK